MTLRVSSASVPSAASVEREQGRGMLIFCWLSVQNAKVPLSFEYLWLGFNACQGERRTVFIPKAVVTDS